MITPEQMQTEVVRALWWKQPYGSMMLFGKDETRKWDTKYRGLVLICCSRQPYTDEQIKSISDYTDCYNMENVFKHNSHAPNAFLGKAIAIGRLAETGPMTRLYSEKTVVRFSRELFVHIYKDVTPIEPFDFKGQQGWKVLSAYEKSKIKLIQ